MLWRLLIPVFLLGIVGLAAVNQFLRTPQAQADAGGVLRAPRNVAKAATAHSLSATATAATVVQNGIVLGGVPYRSIERDIKSDNGAGT